MIEKINRSRRSVEQRSGFLNRRSEVRGLAGPPRFPEPRGFKARLASERPTNLENVRMAMSDSIESNDERPCLHCLIGDVIDDFYAEYGSLSGEKDAIDVDEIITALAKTVAELTYGSDAALRQRVLDDLMRGLSQFEAEFAHAPASDMLH